MSPGFSKEIRKICHKLQGNPSTKERGRHFGSSALSAISLYSGQHSGAVGRAAALTADIWV